MPQKAPGRHWRKAISLPEFADMLPDEAAAERPPPGARSRAVNAAIREWSCASARRNAAARMDSLRTGLQPVATEDVVRWVRKERERRPSCS